MKLGVYLNPQTARDETPQELRDGMFELARTADAVGFDHISAGQHYLSDFTQLQLLPFLSRLTGEVGSIELSTGIVLMPFYHPVELAEQIATIDTFHDGQTVLGVGVGYRDAEFDGFGIPKSERVPRMVEGLELTRKLLSDTNVTYDGDFYSIENATIPVRPDAELPVWIAANANRAVERAARIGDAWMVNPHATISEIAAQKAEYYDPVRNDRGLDPSLPVAREAFVAPTTEEAIATARPYLEEKYSRYVQWGQADAMEDTDDLRRSFEDLAADRFVLGTPAEACEAIERYERELDASHVLFRCHWPGIPYDDVRECFELIGDEVIPNV